MKKGFHHSKESRMKMSKSHKGKRIGHFVSEETRKKIGLANSIIGLGRKVSEETRKKISDNAKINPNYGNKGRKFTKDTIKKLRESHLGYIMPQEQKNKIGISNIGKTKGYKRSEIVKKNLSIAHSTPEYILFAKKRRAKQIFPVKDTSIEVKIQNYLKQLNIDFFTHQYIKEIEHGYQCDILIPSMNLVIECDGDYWHGDIIRFPNPNEMQSKQIEEDKIRTQELIESGFRVLRLWEHEIKVMELNDFKERLK